MKVPPKRKGNLSDEQVARGESGLNESPSEKEGKSQTQQQHMPPPPHASMKVPPKRKGNYYENEIINKQKGLNESPSEKEGKFACRSGLHRVADGTGPQ